MRPFYPAAVSTCRHLHAASSPPYPYSPVYDKYGLNLVPGLSKDKPDFIHDTSWPTVIGETGVMGWGFMAGGLFLLLFRFSTALLRLAWICLFLLGRKILLLPSRSKANG